jgi:flagellar biosynthesis anti-sigma factor FlgM
MKIGSNLENLTQIESGPAISGGAVAKSAVGGAAEQKQTPQADRANVSSVGGQVALSSLSSEVRLDKVASIHSALATGSYAVPASAVASKLVDSMLSSKQ